MKSRGLRSAALAIWLPAIACQAGDTDAHVMSRDSAGVMIVESSAPAVAEGSWSLAPQPRLSIGVVDGAPEYQFTQIQGVGLLPNGHIYVAQLSNPPQVRIFSAQGEHIRSIGRAGQGPGELTGIGWADLLGEDTIRVYDFWASRITHFALSGEVLREIPLQTLAGLPARSISSSPGFAEGHILARSNRMVQADAPKGLGRSTSFLLRVETTGELVDSFPPMPNVDYFGTPERDIVIPLGRRSATLASDSLLFVATGDFYGVQVFGRGGALRAIFRQTGERRAVAPEHVEVLREELLSNAGSDDAKRRVEQSFLETPLPEQLPAYSRAMLVDDVGNLWVERFLAPGDATREWDVFSASGEYITLVSVPSSFEVKQVIGQDVIGIWTGDLDVETVRVYDLAKQEGDRQARTRID